MGGNGGLWSGDWGQWSRRDHWWRRVNLNRVRGNWVAGWQWTDWKVWKVVRWMGACHMVRGWRMMRLKSRTVAGLKAWWICWEMSKYLWMGLWGVVRCRVMGLRAWGKQRLWAWLRERHPVVWLRSWLGLRGRACWEMC